MKKKIGGGKGSNAGGRFDNSKGAPRRGGGARAGGRDSGAERGGGGRSEHYDGNPLNKGATDADWDEDIDDDVAFNSEDEAMFGEHFSKKESWDKQEKKLRKSKQDTAATATSAKVSKAEKKKMRNLVDADAAEAQESMTTTSSTLTTTKKGKKAARQLEQLGDDDENDDNIRPIFDRLNPLEAREAASKKEKTSKKSNGKEKKDNDDEIGSEAFSDDSRSEVDLEDMLMGTDERRAQKEKRRAKRDPRDDKNLAKTSKTLGGRSNAKATEDFLLSEQEGVLISKDTQDTLSRLSSALGSAMQIDQLTAGKKKKKLSAALSTASEKKKNDELFELSTAKLDCSASKRAQSKSELASLKQLLAQTTELDQGKTTDRLLAAANNTKTLISEDIADHEKTKIDRAQTRAIVSQSLQKYDGFLKETKEAKHMRFPLAQPEAAPTPSTLGGIAAALSRQQLAAVVAAGGESDNANIVQQQQQKGSSSSTTTAHGPATGLAAKMQSLLDLSGLAKKVPAPGAVSDGSGVFGEGAEGVVSVRDRDRPDGAEDMEGDENEFVHGRSGGQDGEGKPDRGYMAKLKAMLSYEIARRTRFNKIKSKTYRRILRKEEDRERERREQARELLDPEGARLRRQAQMEKDRALERVTQKHKNTSKWVRHVKQFGKHDESAKEAVQEQLLKHQRLMSKMDEPAGEEWAGYDAAEQASDVASEEADAIVDELLANPTQGAHKAIHQPSKTSIFWQKSTQGAGDAAASDGAAPAMRPIDKARKELQGMTFMKKAKDRDEAAFQEDVRALKDDIESFQRGDELTNYHEGDELSEDSDNVLDNNRKKRRDAKEDKRRAVEGATQRREAAGRRRFSSAEELAPSNAAAVLERQEQAALEAGAAAALPTDEVDVDAFLNDDDEQRLSARTGAEPAADATVSAEGKKKKRKAQVAPFVAGGLVADAARADATRGNTFTATSIPAAAAGTQESNFIGLRQEAKRALGKGTEWSSPYSASATAKEGADNTTSSKRGKKRTDRELTTVDETLLADQVGADDGRGLDGPDGLSDSNHNVAHATTTTGKSASVSVRVFPTASGPSLASQLAFAQAAVKTQHPDADREAQQQLQQEYLASRAFAGDDIDEDFMRLKEQEVEGIMKPIDKNASLPGWGEWGGDSEHLNRRHRARVDKMTLERNLKKSALMKSRADAHLDHLIVSHEAEIVPDKYKLHIVPRPFANAREFALSMRQPLGPESVTPMSFKEGTQPRVTTEKGMIIDPVDLTARKAKAKTKRRKVEKKVTV